MKRGLPVRPVRVEAPAKLNLYLHVVGRRADGYHLLDGLVVFPAVGDTIEVEAAPGTELTCDGPFGASVPRGDDNLVVRAAGALAAVSGRTLGTRMRLTKRLPVSSGIGGGSADAAATLRALVRLWQLDISEERLAALALDLGADVPVCLAARPAYIGGIGEEVVPAPGLPPFWLVLANPGVGVATPAVFAGRAGAFSKPARLTKAPGDVRTFAALLAARDNDLTSAAIALAPEIGEVLAALETLPGILLARMSGSGATCFAMLEGEVEASAAMEALSARHPRWWVAAAPVADARESG